MSLERHTKGFSSRVRYGEGRRKAFPLATNDEAFAVALDRTMTELAARLVLDEQGRAHAQKILEEAAKATSEKQLQTIVDLVDRMLEKVERGAPAKLLTFEDLGKQWTTSELAKKHPDHVRAKLTSDLDGQRLARLYEIELPSGRKFGDMPLRSITLDDCDAVMGQLPATAKTAATRRSYAQLIHHVLELATYPVRAIERSPLPRRWMPKPGKPPRRAFLYPEEDRKLLGVTTIPLTRRVLYGFLAREGCRLGEALSLTWRALDLDMGTAWVLRTKTEEPRHWPLAADTTAALAAWREQRKGEPDETLVFGLTTDETRLAMQLRDDLREAQVTRPQLFEDSKTWGPFRVHDLRASFITLALMLGKSEGWISARTGHTSSQMINRYRRDAESAKELRLGWFAPLHDCIPELRGPGGVGAGSPQGGRQPGGVVSEETEITTKAEVAEWQTRRIQKRRGPQAIPQLTRTTRIRPTPSRPVRRRMATKWHRRTALTWSRLPSPTL